MSPVATNTDVAVLLSQKTPDGATLYLYPVVRDSDVLLSGEFGVDNLEELLEQGIKPSFDSLMNIFQNTDDFEFTFDPTTNVIKGTHKNLISAGSVKGSEGEIAHGGEIRIPSFTFDKNGHITAASTTVIKLPAGYVLPTASETEKGGIKIGTGLTISNDGKTSVNEGTTSVKGIVKLNSATDSDSEADAATPKAVKDALAKASKALADEISKITTNGVKPTFSALSSMFASGSDMEFTFDESGENISVTHKNKVVAGTVSGSEGSVGYGESISIPTLTIDENGHIKSYGTVEVTIPNAYTLPTASETEKGGVIIGDGLSIDPLSGVLSANEGSTEQKGIVKLSNSASNSTSEAATPKAVNDAKEAVQEFATQKVTELKESLESEGTTPTYEGTSELFGDSDNIVVVKNSSGKVISFKHKNEVAEGTVGTGGATFVNGGTILVPTFKYDTNGHITQSGTEQIIIKPFVGRDGITVENEYIGHDNVIESGSTVSNTAGSLAFGGSFNVPEVTYDDHGHITGVTYKALSLPKNPNSDTTYGLSVTGGAESTSVGDAYDTISKAYTLKFTGSDGTNESFNIGSSYFKYHAFTGLNDGLVPSAGSANSDKFLKGDGTWATPANTQYTGSDGIKLDGTVFKHTNAVTAATVSPGTAGALTFGGTIKIPTFAYDTNGHIKSASLVSFTLPDNPIVNYSISKSGNDITLTGTDGSSTKVTITPYTHPTSGVTAGTYKSVTVDANGHVTAGTNPTTLAGYGITDAASLSHKHGNADIESLDGSKITGTLPIAVIPKAALERLVPVTNDTARFALTESDVQLGDTVKVTATGLMYLVKDVSKLNSEDGYEPYSAGAASSVPWSGITNKPSTFEPSAHTHNYAASTSAGGAATTAVGDDKGQKITSTYVTGLSVNGKVITFTYGDGTSKTITTQDTNTTYEVMKAASASAAGGSGLVPAPAAGKQGMFLRGDGTWATPTNTTYDVVTASSNGLMSSDMLVKLNGIAEGANNYTHPAYTAKTSGFYKVTVDATGHVSAVTAVTKADITGLGIPGSDTTYGVVSSTANGLMSTTMLTKLNGIAEGANNYTHPAYTAKTSGLYKVTVDASGHVSATAAVTKADITALGIPGSDTTYSAMTGASASAAGSSGLVPAPAAGKQGMFLRGDGTWATPTNTTYEAATASSLGLVKIGSNISVSSGTISLTKNNVVAALGYEPPTTNTTYSVMKGASSSAAGSSGLVPAPASGKQNAFLRGDGTWVVPTDTTYGVMGGASSSAAGSSGLVPAPASGKQNAFLRGDGTWVVPTDTTYGVVSSTANGLMSTTMLTKLNGIAEGANNYTHPAYTAKASGFYKVTVDATGHVSTVTAVTKADITALGIPGSDTTYGVASTTANGLMSTAMVTKLNGIAEGANNYTHPAYTAKASGLYKVTVDATGHVSAVTAVTKADITGLGIPGSDTTYSAMTGASASAAGSSGLVPAPAAGKQGMFLRGDGTWATPTNTTYSAATASSLGLVKIGSNISVSSGTISLTKDNVVAALGYTPPTTNTVYTHPAYTAKASGFYKVTVDATGHVSATSAVTKSDITALGIPGSDTTYSAMTGASSSAAGSSGLVPAPAAGKQGMFLRGDGTWATPTNTTYGVVSSSANGLMSTAMLTKLNGIADGANKYTHPSYTAKTSGLYKVTVDATGHVSATAAVTKSDITALGIPGSDTTYGVASTTANGLMSSTMVTRLNTELDPIIISADAPSNPSTGYLMWYKVLSTE